MPMSRHVKLLAVLHAVMGVFTLAPGLLLPFLFSATSKFMEQHPDSPEQRFGQSFETVLYLLAGVLVAMAIPSFLAAWGLKEQKRWGRILTLILSVVQLLNLPLGTMLGIYGLWVLLSDEGMAQFGGDQVAPVMQRNS